MDPLELGSMLLSYTRQVALGLVYLTHKAYIHRDLAARNVLVSEDGTVCKVRMSVRETLLECYAEPSLQCSI